MPDRALRVAVVGAGYFAQFHHQAWVDIEGAELVAIADADTERADEASRTVGAKPVASLSEALTEDIDLIDIATPPPTHFDLIDEASGAGKPAICQKPFCGGLEHAKRATRLAEKRGTPLIVHENFRFQPWWRRVKQAMDNGDIGALYDIAYRHRPGDGQGPRAYLDRQPYFQTMPRLLVHETAVHFIDIFRFLFGEPAWVWSDMRRLNPVIKGEDAAIIILGFPDGRRAIFDGNRLSDHAAENRRFTMGEAWIDGSDGTLTIDGNGAVHLRPHGQDARTDLDVKILGDRFGGGCIEALQAHVVDALKTGKTPENTARAYLKNLRLVEAVYQSAETGDRVICDWRTEND